MRRLLVIVCLFAGCGSNDNNHPVDGANPPRDAASSDGSPDAPPDAPTTSASALSFNDGTKSITTWVAPDAFVNGASVGRVFVYNTSSTTSEALNPAFSGPDAADFVTDVGNSTCGTTLAGHDGCWLQIIFHPIAAGTKTASLDVGAASIALTASAPGPITGLTTDLAAVDFGTPKRGDTVQRQLILKNTGASTITLGARTATGPFAYVSDNCPNVLTAGSACTITLTFSSSTLGYSTGTLSVASDANAVTVALQATTLRSVTVAKQGDGTGVITSLPAGIACGTTCVGGFPGGIDIQLNATPDTGMVFAQWQGICSGFASSCTIPSPADGVVAPRFANANDKKVTISFAGTGQGNVAVYTTSSSFPSQECDSNCTIYVPSGTSVQLKGYSASTFVGWTGDCTGTDSLCNLGTVINDRSVTATANKDTYEVATFFLTKVVRGVAVTSTGDLIIGAPDGVSKMSIAGSVEWTTEVTGNVEGLVTDAVDEVFVVGDSTITKLGATGAIVWTKPITANRKGYANNAAVAVSPDGTVIAVLTASGLRALDANGDDRFSVTNASVPTSVAVGADGTIALGEQNPNIGDTPQIALYSSAGVALSPYVFGGAVNTAVAYDPNNNLLVVTAGEGQVSASRWTGAAESFFRSESINTPSGPPPFGVAATSSGELVKVRRNQVGITFGAYKLDLYSTTGTVNYTISKPFDASTLYTQGVANGWLASGPANRVVIGGTYGESGGARNWVQVLDLP